MKALIVDDHRIVREGIRLLLDAAPQVERVVEASGGREALERIRAERFDVVLLDVRMPDMDGFQLLKHIGELDAPPRVIVLSMYDDAAYVKRAIELGASGYLLKSVGRDELLRALEVVAGGGSYLQGEITAPLVAKIVDPGAGGPVGELGPEEIGMLEMLAEGLDNRAIATRLGISEPTVKARLRAIYATLEVKRRSEAVAVALRLGLIR